MAKKEEPRELRSDGRDPLTRDPFTLELDLRSESARQGAGLYAAYVMIEEEENERARGIFELIKRARAKFPDHVVLNEDPDAAPEAAGEIDPLVKKLDDLNEEPHEAVKDPEVDGA